MPRSLRLTLPLLLAVAAGCGGIRVRQHGPVDLVLAWQDSLGLGGRLSPRSEQTLRRQPGTGDAVKTQDRPRRTQGPQAYNRAQLGQRVTPLSRPH